MTADAESSSDTVHARIRDAIVSSEFRPNHRLVEEELAAWLNVSRTPVREALLRLKQDGLVERNRGWIVRDHAPEEILGIVEARAAVESSAAFLAADRIDAATLDRLTALCAQMETPGASRIELSAVNDDFHDTVTEAAGNQLLVQFARRTRINYWNFTRPVVLGPDDDELTAASHRDLVAALRDRDGARAQRIVREHIDHTGAVVATALGLAWPPHP